MNTALLPLDSYPKHVQEQIQAHFKTTENINHFLTENAVFSTPQLVERIKQFAKKLKLGQKGKFTCIFPFNTPCTFSVTLTYTGEIWRKNVTDFQHTKLHPQKNDDLKEASFYMKQIGPEKDFDDLRIRQSVHKKDAVKEYILQSSEAEVIYHIKGKFPIDLGGSESISNVIHNIALENDTFKKTYCHEYAKCFVIMVTAGTLTLAGKIYLDYVLS